MRRERSDSDSVYLHRDPEAFSRLFASTRLAPAWVLPRVYVGWVWLSIGWAMLQSPSWMRDGSVLTAPWQQRSGAFGLPESQSEAGFSLMSLLIGSELPGWIARFTAIGLTVTGIALILGIATGAAAFGGAILSVNAVASGSLAPGPEVFALAMLLVLAWRTAGWIGLDRWALPLLGAPWPGGFAMTAGETGKELQHIQGD